MLRKKTRRLIAFLCATLLMSSQFAVAAYTCPQIAPPSVQTSALAATQETNISADCMRAMKAQPSVLCKAHCELLAQSSQVPAIALAPSVWLNLWVVARLDMPDPASPPVTHDSLAWLTDSSPPLRIQYQVFRI